MATIKDTKVQTINVFNNPENVIQRHGAAIYALDQYIRSLGAGAGKTFGALLKKEDTSRSEFVLVDFLNAKSIKNWITGHKPVEPNIFDNDNDLSQFDDCFRNSAVENKTLKDGEYTLYIRTNRMQDSTDSADTKPIKVFAKVYLDNFICGPTKKYDSNTYKDAQIFYKIIKTDRKPTEDGESKIKNAVDKWLGRYQEWEIRYKITLDTRSSLEKLHELAIEKCGIDKNKYEINASDFIDAAIKPKEINLLELKYKSNKFISKKSIQQELEALRPIIAKYLKTFWMPVQSDILDDSKLTSIFDSVGTKIIAKSLYTIMPTKGAQVGFTAFFRFIVESNVNIDSNQKIISLVNANSNKSAKTLIENIVTNKIRSKIIETLK